MLTRSRSISNVSDNPVIDGLCRFCLPRFRNFVLGSALVLTSPAAVGAELELDAPVRVSEWYIGAGAGVSTLQPDPNNTNYRLTEEHDRGWVLFLGRDFSRHWTAEILYSEMGTAEMTNQSIPSQVGEVTYNVFAITSQYYFNQKSERGFRRGWQPYLRLGFARLKADHHNFINTSVQQVNDSQLYYGGGIEYSWDSRWALRASVDVYDVDAKYLGISLLKRFGGKKSKPVIVEEVALEPESAAVVPVVPAIVYSDVCTQFEGVNFWYGSADLTGEATEILERVSQVLIENPDLQVEIQAHTDSEGVTEENQVLSEARANTVRDYLIANGIDGGRLVPRGFGETRPIVSNDTVVGRAQNRRVEFRLTDQSLCQ